MSRTSFSSAATIPLRRGEELRFTRETTSISLRIWFQAANGEWRPGRAGIELPVRTVGAAIAMLGRLGGGAA